MVNGPWLTRRFPPVGFTVGYILGALVALTGLFFGPVYPMLIAIGVDLYPGRLAALSGGLTGAGALGIPTAALFAATHSPQGSGVPSRTH